MSYLSIGYGLKFFPYITAQLLVLLPQTKEVTALELTEWKRLCANPSFPLQSNHRVKMCEYCRCVLMSVCHPR